ncbi:631_t:CDS:2 [Cetraspora pellucida]|uniref:631_t:CDS:1 n=1 Tax=Cetraspora pellucida TaxID=1433469 RepID=A0ACA9K5L7_9GLOM|nr:631_t:CDS:2 [Cetraspora pellucida]
MENMQMLSNSRECTRCKKTVNSNQFLNSNNDDNYFNTCFLCRQQSSIHYKLSTKPDENQVISLKEMTQQLYCKIIEISTNEYMENELNGIDFKCDISLEEFEGDPKEISNKIKNAIDTYNSKKTSQLVTFRYRCSQCQNLAKKPRKHENIENQRDRQSIQRFDCKGTIKIVINVEANCASVHLKHSTIHKRPDRYGVSEEIKAEIQKHLHLSPKICPFLFIPSQQFTHDQQYFLMSNEQYWSDEHSISALPCNLSEENIMNDITSLVNNISDEEPCQLFEEYKSILQDALTIVQEQHAASNTQWAQSVYKSFDGIRTMVNDIKRYRKRITNPRTWKDHNRNTMFLEK